MKWSDIKKREKFKEAPGRGQILAYTRKEVVFCEYSNKEDIKEFAEDDELLEIHLFDSEKEYRGIMSRSPRFPEGWIDVIVGAADDTYVERVLLEDEDEVTLCIENHLAFDEDTGMAYVNNYRLIMGGKS